MSEVASVARVVKARAVARGDGGCARLLNAVFKHPTATGQTVNAVIAVANCCVC